VDGRLAGSKNVKFDYGDNAVVRVKNDAGIVVEKRCAVVGITPVENEEQAKHFKRPVGTVLYTVEFGDGADALVSEADLLPADGPSISSDRP
jgi:hypothetical protein